MNLAISCGEDGSWESLGEHYHDENSTMKLDQPRDSAVTPVLSGMKAHNLTPRDKYHTLFFVTACFIGLALLAAWEIHFERDLKRIFRSGDEQLSKCPDYFKQVSSICPNSLRLKLIDSNSASFTRRKATTLASSVSAFATNSPTWFPALGLGFPVNRFEKVIQEASQTWYQTNYWLSSFVAVALLARLYFPRSQKSLAPFRSKLPLPREFGRHKLIISQWIILLWIGECLYPRPFACTDIGPDLRSGKHMKNYECLEFHTSSSTFLMSCSVKWSKTENDTCIILKKNENFDGKGHEIDLEGLNDWDGLIQIADPADGGPTSLGEAPIVRNLHMKGGQTSVRGGFVIYPEQNNFIVDSCSSSGTIEGMTEPPWDAGGGICGHGCSGAILITDCWSSGTIQGKDAGGIVGGQVGTNGGHVVIQRCHSTGDIAGRWSGGIAGWAAGEENGNVSITHSYSTGNLVGNQTGGICGWGAGYESGYTSINYCYSTGDIIGNMSGGICASHTALYNGTVSISRCYSLGTIIGSESGGLLGRSTAQNDGFVAVSDSYSQGKIIPSALTGTGGIIGHMTGYGRGTVVITNVYSSGAGAIIGRIFAGAAKISVTMSVYNGDSIVGVDTGDDDRTDENNSNDLRDINGTVFCTNAFEERKCWDNVTVWQTVPNAFPILRGFDLPMTTPLPTHKPRRIVWQPLPVQRGRRYVV